MIMPDARAAIRYLETSGATPISLMPRDGSVGIHVGKIDPGAMPVFWLPEEHAVNVSRAARTILADHPCPDTMAAMSAIRQAATEHQPPVRLTDHHVAVERAGQMDAQLDALIEQLRTSGWLKEFNRVFKGNRQTFEHQGKRYT